MSLSPSQLFVSGCLSPRLAWEPRPDCSSALFSPGLRSPAWGLAQSSPGRPRGGTDTTAELRGGRARC